MSPIVYRANQLIIAYHQKQQAYQHELEYTAFHDSLTGLPNRTHFYERLPRAGFAPLRIAVNVSAHQFKQPDFVGVVRKILDNTGLDPKYLELELTESAIMEDAQTSIATLDELKRMGIHIAMDDFGSGYSSLSYLKRIPIDTLKIDQSFIRNLSSSSDNAAIVTAIMALEHSLRLNVVAEGVEEAKELMFLSALGCHVIQGFYFSKLLPADEFTRLQGDSTRFISMLESLRTA